MAFEIIRNDLTKMKVDAIVNTANPQPVVGGGTDRAIHAKAGPQLLEARRKIGLIRCGESAITPAFGLDARYVIHTVSPIWEDGRHREEALLRKAYEGALELADTYHCKSIAFPLMAAGSDGFPHDLALSVAVHACHDFLLQHRMRIYLVVFSGEAFHLSQRLAADVKSYIDDHYVSEHRCAEYGANCGEPVRRGRLPRLGRAVSGRDACGAMPAAPEASIRQLQKDLDERLSEKQETFSEAMDRMIRERHLLDPEVYGRIDMNRTTFNKIKNDKHHRPQRKTAIQLAIALRLDLDQTQDFIAKAGYTLSQSSMADVILSFCLNMAIYDTQTIDALLVDRGEKAIFSQA